MVTELWMWCLSDTQDSKERERIVSAGKGVVKRTFPETARVDGSVNRVTPFLRVIWQYVLRTWRNIHTFQLYHSHSGKLSSWNKQRLGNTLINHYAVPHSVIFFFKGIKSERVETFHHRDWLGKWPQIPIIEVKYNVSPIRVGISSPLFMLYLQHLSQCQAHSRHSANLCWMSITP